MNKKNLLILLYSIVPVAVSIISTIHVVKLFNLGNGYDMSIATSVIFELAHIASFVGLLLLNSNLKAKIANYVVFFILFLIQIIGNVYFSYDYISGVNLATPEKLTSLKEITSFIMGTEISSFEAEDIIAMKLYISMLVSFFIPVISLILFSLLPVAISTKAIQEPVIDEVVEDSYTTEEPVYDEVVDNSLIEESDIKYMYEKPNEESMDIFCEETDTLHYKLWSNPSEYTTEIFLDFFYGNDEDIIEEPEQDIEKVLENKLEPVVNIEKNEMSLSDTSFDGLSVKI